MSHVIDLSLPENKITQELMDCFLRIHKIMGPGLLESIYEECLCHEMTRRNLAFERQKELPLTYDGTPLNTSLRLDIVVENTIIIEVKSVDTLMPVHEAQLLTYLKMAQMKIGLLVNFNVPLIKHGVKRFVL